MKVASFNVNSIRARLPIVIAWLQKNRPDVLAVQNDYALHLQVRGRSARGCQRLGHFHIGGVITAVAESDIILAGIGQHVEFV